MLSDKYWSNLKFQWIWVVLNKGISFQFNKAMVKILSNFDTNLDDIAVQEAAEEFGKDQVCFVRRDRIYVLLKIIIPVFIRLIMAWLLLALAYTWWVREAVWNLFSSFIWIIVLITWSILARKVIWKVIDYYMDFTIITPKTITAYDQNWIFTRNTRSLEISKIKSIRVMKEGIFRSLFNFGTIVFFSEGDETMWDIRLNYISAPQNLNKKLAEILKLNSQKTAQNEDQTNKE